MRNIYFLGVILLFFINCKSVFKRNEKCNCSVEYYISNIDSINNYYIIYAREVIKGHKYKIISKKEICNSRSKIRPGNTYYLEIKSLFSAVIDGKEYVIDNIDCAVIENNSFCKEPENLIFDVSKSKNLKGLCYNKN